MSTHRILVSFCDILHCKARVLNASLCTNSKYKSNNTHLKIINYTSFMNKINLQRIISNKNSAFDFIKLIIHNIFKYNTTLV